MKAIGIVLMAMALVGCYSPQEYAAGDVAVIAAKAEADRLDSETKTESDRQAIVVQAEATRQAVMAVGQAQLELERAQELQRQTLSEQAQKQEADHAIKMADIEARSTQRLAEQDRIAKARLADIEAQSAQRLADIKAQEAESVARGNAAWVKPTAEAFVIGTGALGLAIAIILIALTARRMGSAWALKVERQADTPLLFHYDRNTLMAPVVLTLVAGRPVAFNPNTGEVFDLDRTHNADAARLRYQAAQNMVALQRNGEHAPMLPSLEEHGIMASHSTVEDKSEK